MESSENQNDTEVGAVAAGGQDAVGPDTSALREQVLEALKVVHDPEIPVNIVDLGLVYDLDIDAQGNVNIEMTLTSMGCPVQDLIQSDTEMAAMKVDGVNSVSVDFVWSPPWSTAKMTDDGKKQMRMFGFNV
ncbi:MAG TPA: iron-sulfur cluster assembly protein [Trueperaceae bacterium]|nr:iron-sulfur cluster assembly protein [Trueperaceae bacterium]HRP47773.1 iron-sulfur cluster assembly protein [Trueperaceae bacterium]